jgi:hypothetical protein
MAGGARYLKEQAVARGQVLRLEEPTRVQVGRGGAADEVPLARRADLAGSATQKGGGGA